MNSEVKTFSNTWNKQVLKMSVRGQRFDVDGDDVRDPVLFQKIAIESCRESSWEMEHTRTKNK